MSTNPYYLDHALLNQGETRWGNLGYWATATTYPEAAAALAKVLGEAAALQPTDQILDVGFGAGESLHFWRETYGITQVVGQELMPEYIQGACQRFAARPFDLLCGSDLTHFKAESFDKVLALDCAYHFQPRASFFSQAWSALKPGGRLALTDLALAQFPLNPLTRPMLEVAAFASAIPRENFITLETYRHQLEAAGFMNIQIHHLEAHVFVGFAQFISRHAQRYFWQSPRLHWLKLIATGLGLAELARHEWFHYLLITADKLPPGTSHTQSPRDLHTGINRTL